MEVKATVDMILPSFLVGNYYQVAMSSNDSPQKIDQAWLLFVKKMTKYSFICEPISTSGVWFCSKKGHLLTYHLCPNRSCCSWFNHFYSQNPVHDIAGTTFIHHLDFPLCCSWRDTHICVRRCSLGGLKTLLATADKGFWGNVNSGTGLGQNQGNGHFW